MRKKFFIGLGIALVLAVVGFVIWAEIVLPADQPALDALISDSDVIVTTGDYVTFAPASSQPTTGFIFYPGGRVDYRAYAVPLRMIAEQGYFVALVPVRLNLAFFDINAGEKVLTDHPEIKVWAAGGHSLGGVASALYAKDHLDLIKGLIFWGSYPADDSLKNSSIKVLSIYGTLDMAGMAKFDETRGLFPADSEWVVIEGGNHAQFGDYGFQPGDYEAAIRRADQQQQTVEAVVQFLQSLGQ